MQSNPSKSLSDLSLKALILSGGVAHPYAQTSQQLKQILEPAGIQSLITENLDILASPKLKDFDIVALNCVWWTCDQTPSWRDKWHYELSEVNRLGLLNHLRSGKGLLALHAATICFDDWPEYRKILGAWWEWGKSGHGPYQEHRMKVRLDAHPIVAGMGDFSIIDELYTYPQITDAIEPLISGEWDKVEHPMLWVRSYEKARVCYCALGHGVETFENGTFQTLLQRSALWVAKKLEREKAQ